MDPAPALGDANRVFAALDLPDDLRAVLAAEGARVAAAVHGRAVAAANLHMTLLFLGRVPPPAGPGLADALRRAVADGPERPLRVRIGAMRPRPSARRARLVAADIADVDGEVAALAGRVRAGLAGALGRPPEDGAFWPHVTVAACHARGVSRWTGRRPQNVCSISAARRSMIRRRPRGAPPRYRALVQVPIGGG